MNTSLQHAADNLRASRQQLHSMHPSGPVIKQAIRVILAHVPDFPDPGTDPGGVSPAVFIDALKEWMTKQFPRAKQANINPPNRVDDAIFCLEFLAQNKSVNTFNTLTPTQAWKRAKCDKSTMTKYMNKIPGLAVTVAGKRRVVESKLHEEIDAGRIKPKIAKAAKSPVPGGRKFVSEKAAEVARKFGY